MEETKEDKIANLEKQIEDMKKTIEELKCDESKEENTPVENKRWRAEPYECLEYCYIDHDGNIEYEYEAYDSIDDWRFQSGNYFKTKEEAEQYKKWILARQVLVDDAKNFKRSKDDENGDFYVFYDVEDKVFRIDYEAYISHNICFKTEEDVKASIDKHLAEWKIYLGIEE